MEANGVVCTGLGDTRLCGLFPHLSLDGGGRNSTIVEWRVTKDKQHLIQLTTGK